MSNRGIRIPFGVPRLFVIVAIVCGCSSSDTGNQNGTTSANDVSSSSADVGAMASDTMDVLDSASIADVELQLDSGEPDLEVDEVPVDTDVPLDEGNEVSVLDAVTSPDTDDTFSSGPELPVSDTSSVGLDTGAEPETVGVDAGDPKGTETYENKDGCAVPIDYETTACKQTDCESGLVCMGSGVCVPDGPFMIEPDLSLKQAKIALANVETGGFAAAWYDYSGSGTAKKMDVRFRLYHASGQPASDMVKVDEDTMNWARSPSMTRMADGGQLVVWRGQAGNSGEVRYMARVINPQGVPTGTAFQLNQTPLVKESGAVSNVDSPFARLLRNGSIGVAWMGTPKDTPGDINVYLRVLAPDGQPMTDELDTGAQTTDDESSPVVTDTASSGLAIYWQHSVPGAAQGNNGIPGKGSSGSFTHVIKGRLFDQFAQPQGEVFQLTEGVEPSENMPSSMSFKGGDLFVTWKTRKKPTSTVATTIWGMKASAQGANVGNVVHEFGLDPQGYYPFYAPVVAMDSDRAAVVWHTVAPGLDGVYMRRYYASEDIIDCDTTHVSSPKLPDVTSAHRLPAIIGFSDGRVLVGWGVGSTGGATKAVLRYFD